jgi:hypothetical protein
MKNFAIRQPLVFAMAENLKNRSAYQQQTPLSCALW